VYLDSSNSSSCRSLDFRLRRNHKTDKARRAIVKLVEVLKLDESFMSPVVPFIGFVERCLVLEYGEFA
jgi:hypothetical protein